MFKSFQFIALFFVSFLAYAAKQVELPPSNKVQAPGVLALSAAWIKDKGDKYDIRLSMENLSEEGIIIFAGNLQCFRNGTRGELKYTFFNTGEKIIDFKPGEVKSNNYVCDLNSHEEGTDYKIVVKMIYANKTLDGKTVSEKPIAKDLEWKQTFINGLPTTK